jgi:hypothetical protein
MHYHAERGNEADYKVYALPRRAWERGRLQSICITTQSVGTRQKARRTQREIQ